MTQPSYDMFGPNPTNPNRGPFTGRSEEISAGQRISVLQSYQCDVPDHVTLCLTRRVAANTTSEEDIGARMPLVAHVRWGVGQEYDTADVDWLNGTLITVPAGSITVEADYAAQGGGVVVPKQHVGVILAPGKRPPAAGSQPLARLTTRLPALPTGIAVPPRAHAVQLLTNSPANYGSVQLDFRFTAGTMAGADIATSAIPSSPEQLAIPNGVRSVYASLIGGPAQVVTLVWSIAL